MVWYWRLGDIPTYYDTRKQKHRPAIFTCPVSRRQLKVLVEFEGILDRIERCFGGGKIGEILLQVSRG
jgi:hypothetical protein